MQIFRQALNLWEQLENERGMANAYNNMGIIYDYRGQFDKSVEQYSQALELKRTIHDTIGLADAYNNLSVVYHYRGLYQQALEKYQQAEDLDGLAYIYDNVGDWSTSGRSSTMMRSPALRMRLKFAWKWASVSEILAVLMPIWPAFIWKRLSTKRLYATTAWHSVFLKTQKISTVSLPL